MGSVVASCVFRVSCVGYSERAPFGRKASVFFFRPSLTAGLRASSHPRCEAAAIRQLSDNYQTTIRQLSDNYQTNTKMRGFVISLLKKDLLSIFFFVPEYKTFGLLYLSDNCLIVV